MVEKAKIIRGSGLITNKDFTITANQIGYESEIATYLVPQNRVLELPDKFIGLKLMTKDTFSFSTATGETSHGCTLTYPIARNELISMKGANVIVVKRTPTPVAEWAVANYSVTEPNTVTISGLTQSTAYVFDIYYLFNNGSVNITIVSDDGNVKAKVLERAIGKVNTLNQEDVRAGLKYGQIGLVIPERYKVQIRVITNASIILWDPVADSRAKSKYARESYIELPVDISDILQWPEGVKTFAKSQLGIA
jgi:hypothetical protein